MDDRPIRPTPPGVTEAIEASLRDVAEGNLHDALTVHAEGLQLLADFERGYPLSGKRSRMV